MAFRWATAERVRILYIMVEGETLAIGNLSYGIIELQLLVANFQSIDSSIVLRFVVAIETK